MSLRRISALAVVGALLVSGCQDEPEPRFEDPTESPTASASESSDPPEQQSAEEFIKTWFELAVDMQNTGETNELRAASPGCEPCSELMNRVEGIYGAGGHVHIDSMRVTNVRHLSNAEYSVIVKAAPTRIQESGKAKERVIPANTNEYRMFVRRQQGTWVMSDYLDTPS